MKNGSVATTGSGLQEGVITKEKHVEVLQDDKIVLYPNCSGGSMNLCLSQISQSCTPKSTSLYVNLKN